MVREVRPSEVIESFIPEFNLFLRGLNDTEQIITFFKLKETRLLTVSHSDWEDWDLSASLFLMDVLLPEIFFFSLVVHIFVRFFFSDQWCRFWQYHRVIMLYLNG